MQKNQPPTDTEDSQPERPMNTLVEPMGAEQSTEAIEPPEDWWRVPDDWRRLPDDWWRNVRLGSASGRYRGEMTAPTSGRYELVLRVDIDPARANSPVMDRVSGDVFQKYRFSWGGRTYEWSVYRESWIVDNPSVNWQRSYVDIKGAVRYWEGNHPSTRIGIRIPWATFRPAGPAEVSFWESGNRTADRYTCKRESSLPRELTLEVDICDSVNNAPILPEYDTHSHNTRPSDLPRRTLTMESAYAEAGIDLTVSPVHTIIDDSDPQFTRWSVGELHDAMENHFSQHPGSWPKWHMWGVLAGEFDSPSVAGIMFDARASYGGAGDAPERQGFAVFRDHQWFDDLTSSPSTQAEAEAMRQYLYTWIHEAGHAFNFLHSWDKGRSGSLSWMNYPHRVTDFWDDFAMEFDDLELLHMRHGNRNAVIMGGDAWATGGHLEDAHEVPSDRLSPAEGDTPAELLVRSAGFFEYLEPVEVELRLRNLVPDMPLWLDTRLEPEAGNVALFIKQPDGTVVRHEPVYHQLGEPERTTLAATEDAVEGDDRYSQTVYIGYGKDGHYFDQPGEYELRAAYEDRDTLRLVSNTHTLRVGAPQSRDENRLAKTMYSDEVGMTLALGGSRSPYLEAGMDALKEVASELEGTVAGAKAASVVARSLESPFFSLREDTLTKIHDADPTGALGYTETAKEVFEATDDRSLNIPYHDMMRRRAKLLADQGDDDQAREEMETLRETLADRGVNEPVLEEITAFAKSI